MKTNIFLGLLVAGALCAVQSVQAHHAFAAQYDPTKPLTLNGTVTRMEWSNPHGWDLNGNKEAGGKVKPLDDRNRGPEQLVCPGAKEACLGGRHARDGKGLPGQGGSGARKRPNAGPEGRTRLLHGLGGGPN